MIDKRLSLKLAILTAAMFGFGFALVPIYEVFCEITGFGGRTAASAQTVVERPDENRSIRLEFVASVNRSAPFEFRPKVSSMQITPGKIYQTAYFARNLRDADIVARAVPSVSPGSAAEHLKKIECFCFTEQFFEAGEGRDMSVSFMVDPGLPDHIDTLSLSYALFADEN